MTTDPVRGSVFDRRRLGVLLHPSSLPGPGLRGDLGQGARHFVDLIANAGVSVWQVLPLGPPGGGSPYNSLSAHAGDPGLISLEEIAAAGFLTPALALQGQRYDEHRAQVMRAAYHTFQEKACDADRVDLVRFKAQHSSWLSDYCLYQCLKEQYRGVPWWEWPPGVRDRDRGEMGVILTGEGCEFVAFEQFMFFRQWHALRAYARARGIGIFGDIPIFVAEDSADVWAHRDLFVLDAYGRPEIVTGVPPDYFSAEGQRWGNPHYRWAKMAEDGFSWWRNRVATQRELFDWMRIDHFRGLEAAWAIPFKSETGVDGHWLPVPGDALLASLRDCFGSLPLVAEDLGLITDAVYALRDLYGLPGMRVLQFAFDGNPDNPHLPHNYMVNSVAYTGTHDNDTTVGWFAGLSETERRIIRAYLPAIDGDGSWGFIRAVIASVASLAVIPWQDVLGLGTAARMNTPGTSVGNWGFRFAWQDIPREALDELRHLATLYGRKVDLQASC